MRAHPADLDERDVVAALGDGWDLDAQDLTYVPEGGGSYHWRADTGGGSRWFVTADDLDSKPWLGTDRDSTFDELRRAFDVALALRGMAGCRFAVAPVRTTHGASLHRLSAKYSLAVFPHLDGEAGVWGRPLEGRDRTQLLVALAELHQAPAGVRALASRRGLDLPGRSHLQQALAQVDIPWIGGPFAEPARSALAANADAVRGWLSTFDELSDEVARSGRDLVVTHGEPHPGNTIRSGDSLLLIDWDTVGLAPAERDLWMLDDGTSDGLAPYLAATGHEIDAAAMALYRLTWTLADLAAFAAVLRAPHDDNADTRKALAAFSSYF